MFINGKAYYTDIDFFPQAEIKAAVKLLEEASVLWQMYDENDGEPHYYLAQSKAAEAGHMIYEWSVAETPPPRPLTRDHHDSMRDVIYAYAPKKDYRCIDMAWKGIGGWVP